jgi:hypothetical protein
MHEEPASRAESLCYMSTVGSMLLIGHVTSPIAARMASSLASAMPYFKVKDIKTMNAAIRKLKNGTTDIAVLFYPTIKISIEKPIWLVFTDASFNADVAKNRAGVLVTRSFGLDYGSPCISSISVHTNYGESRDPQKQPKIWPAPKGMIVPFSVAP